jgi:peroxiredoxin
LKRLNALLLACVLLGVGVAAGAKAPKVGDPVLDFTLEELRGDTVSLNDYSGKAVLMFFFGFN